MISFKVRILCFLCRSSSWLLGNFTIYFCSHLFLRSVYMAAMDFLEQNGPADLIKLAVEENKVQFYGYICFSCYDRFKRWTIKIRHIDTSVFGSILPFHSTELVEKNGTRSTWIQKSIFTCAKPNAYIYKHIILIDYFNPMHTACFDLLDQNDWKSEEICVPFASRSRNVHIHLKLFYTLELSSTSTLLDCTCDENNLFISTILNR